MTDTKKGLPFDPGEFKHISVVERLATALVQKILAGELTPGERIIEIGLAKQAGVGQGSVREALIQLGHKGFVTRLAGRGTYVTKLTPAEIAQIIQVRLPLEMLVLELAKKVLAPAHIDSVRKALDRMGAESTQNLYQYSVADLAFHEAMWNITGNQVLINTLRSLCSRLFAFGLGNWNPPLLDNLSVHIENHARLLESLIHDDLRTSQEIVTQHITHYWRPEEM